MKKILTILFFFPLLLKAQTGFVNLDYIQEPNNNPTINVTGLLTNFTTGTSSPSSAQYLDVSWTSLTANMQIAALPSWLEASLNGGGNYGATQILFGSGAGTQRVHFRVKSSVPPGNYTVDISFTSTGTSPNPTPKTVRVTATVSASATPTNVVNPTSLNLSTTVVGNPGSVFTVILNGTNLNANDSLIAGAGVEILENATNTWKSSYIIQQAGGSIINYILSVRLKGDLVSNISGNIAIYSTGAVTVLIPYTGSVISATVQDTVVFQFNFSLNEVLVAGFTNVPIPSQTHPVSKTDFTNWQPVTVTSVAGQWNGVTGYNTNGNSSVTMCPSAVGTNYWDNNRVGRGPISFSNVNLIISGLDPTKVYRFTFFITRSTGCSAGSGNNGSMVYLWDSTTNRMRSALVEAKGNDIPVEFFNVVPDAAGKVYASIQPPEGGQAAGCNTHGVINGVKGTKQATRQGAIPWWLFIGFAPLGGRRKRFRLSIFGILLSILSFGQLSETHNFVTYDTVLKLTGISNPTNQPWFAVRISRPVNMFTPGNQDTASRPAIITMPGAGEVNADTSVLKANTQKYGPHYWLNHGWDGSVVLGNGTHYPILITITTSASNVRPPYMRQLIDTLRRRYHIKWNSMHFAGLSMGGFTWGRLLTYSTDKVETSAMSMMRSYTALQGIAFEDFNGFSFGASGFGKWAQLYDGRYFGLEGTNDTRETWRARDTMLVYGSTKGYFSYENIGGGAHCCWNDMYDPSATNWRCVAPITNPNIVVNNNHANSMGTYTGGSLFQWMLRQGDSSIVGGCSPLNDMGPNQTVDYPLDATIYPKDSALCGRSITSVRMRQLTGPNQATIITDPDYNMVDLSNGTSANEQTKFYVSHAEWLNQSNPAYLAALKNRAGLKTMRIPIDPWLTFVPTKFDSLNRAHLAYLDSVILRNYNAGFNLLIDPAHDLGGWGNVNYGGGKSFFDSLYTGSWRNGFGPWWKAWVLHIKNDLHLDPRRVALEIWNEPKDPGNANVQAQYDLQDTVLKYIRSVDTTFWVGVTGFGSNTATFGGMNVTVTGNYKMRVYSAYTKVFYIYHAYVPALLVFVGKNQDNSQGSFNLPYPATHATATRVADSLIQYDCETCNGTYGTPFIGTKGQIWIYAHSQTWNYQYMDSIFRNVWLFGQINHVPVVNTEWMNFQYGNAKTTGTKRDFRLSYIDDYNEIHRHYNIPAITWDPNGDATRIDSNKAINEPIRIDDTLVTRMGWKNKKTGQLYDKRVTITGLVPGVYTFRRTVIDNTGDSTIDDVTITVNPLQVPQASAGGNQNVTLPDNNVNLPGSAAARGSAFLSTIQWTQISGPNSATIVSPTSAITDVTGLVQGVYKFRITVTDSYDNTNFDEATITVVGAGPVNRIFPSYGMGEYVIACINTDRKWYTLSTNNNMMGLPGGIKGLMNKVVDSAIFAEACAGLHFHCAIDTAGVVHTCGENTVGQSGSGTVTNYVTNYRVKTDSAGNPMQRIDHAAAFFMGNKSAGWYFYTEGSPKYYMTGDTRCGSRGDGSFGLSVSSRPVPITFPVPIKKMQASYIAVALSTDGSVWTWGGGDTLGHAPQYENLGYRPVNAADSVTGFLRPRMIAPPGSAVDIAVGVNFYYYIKPDGGVVGWGIFGGYMFAANNSTKYGTPTDLSSIISTYLSAPIVRMVCNHMVTYALCADGNLWGWGDNAMGMLNDGNHFNFAGANPPLAYDFLPYKLPVRFPKLVLSGIKYIYPTSAAFIFYGLNIDSTGQLRTVGRNKSSVLCDGVVPNPSRVESDFPQSWDRYYFTKQNPFALSQVWLSPSPICKLYPDSADCGDYAIPANTSPAVNAGSNQTISSSSVTLDGSASTDDQHISYYTWKQVSGPNQARIYTPAEAITKVDNLTVGTYVFNLEIEDNGRDKSNMNVVITVTTGGPGNPDPPKSCKCVIGHRYK